MTTESTGLLLAGDLYMDRLAADGTSQGFLQVANATQMALQQQVEFQDLSSRRRDTYGQLLASVPVPQPGEVSLSLNEINRDNLALALLGDVVNVDQASETFTALAITLKGTNWTEIGHRNIASGLTVTHNTTTLVEGTDYEINYRLGLIRALKGGSLSGGESLELDGGTNALTGSRISGAVQPSVKAKLKLDGKNLANDRPVLVTVDEAILRPTEAVDFLSDEFVSVPMTGRMRTLAGKSAPYTVELLDAF